MTLVKLAKILGISPMMVSLVVNQRPGPSDETRKRVLEAVKKYGYQPSLAARQLYAMRNEPAKSGSGPTRPVLVLTTNHDSRLKEISAAVQSHNRITLLWSAPDVETMLKLALPLLPELLVNLSSVPLPLDTGLPVVNGGKRSGIAVIEEMMLHFTKKRAGAV